MNVAFPSYVSIVVAWVGGSQRPLELGVVGGHVRMRSKEAAHRHMPGFVSDSDLRHVHVKPPGLFLGIPKEVEIRELRVEQEQIAESLQGFSIGPHRLDPLYVDVDIDDRLRC